MITKKYIFGPVLSRRLGLSLGVDVTSHKVCTYDCIYCQIGKTTNLTVERKEYVPTNAVLSELAQVILLGVKADYVTFSGFGEPTLHSNLGFIVKKAKEISGLPVAVITNGALLYDEGVRKDLLEADIVMPSLDAGLGETFKKINRHHASIDFKKMVDGLIEFRSEYKKQIWLEILFVEGVNDGEEEIAAIKNILEKVKPDRIHLNTIARPPIEKDAKPVSMERLKRISEFFGNNAEVIAEVDKKSKNGGAKGTLHDIEGLLKRHPCGIDEICVALNLEIVEVEKYMQGLMQKGIVKELAMDGKSCFKLSS